MKIAPRILQYHRGQLKPLEKAVREELHRRRRLYLIIAFCLGLLLSRLAVNAAANYFDQYRLIPQPVIQPPFKIEERQTVYLIATPTPTPDPTISQLVDYVWLKETGRGTALSGYHIKCRNKGLWNEIGYNLASNFCFNSKAEGLEFLYNTLAERVAKNGIKETLCVWNLGYNRDTNGNRIPYETCNYYTNLNRYIGLNEN